LEEKILREVDAILRWKVICRDIPFGKRNDIRLNCCKVQQRCIKTGPAFRCENIKRSKCWWRGAVRGDVWIQDQNGEWQEVNVVGSFRYLDDKEAGIKVDTQFTQVGSGSVTSSIVLSTRGSVIKAREDGSVLINGKSFSSKTGTLMIRFIKKKVITKVLKKSQKNTTIILGLTSDRLGFVYDKKTKSYELTVVSQDLSKGLFVDPANPKKYQLTKKNSLFDKFIAFKNVVSNEGTPKQRKKAFQCCQHLDSDAKVNQCISDFIKTKKCFVEEFGQSASFDSFLKK